jgi:hypothetical protein
VGGGENFREGASGPSARAVEIIVVCNFDLQRKEFFVCRPLCQWKNRRYLRATPTNPTPMPDDLDQPKLGKHGGPRAGAGRPKRGESRERKNQGDNVGDNVTLNSRGNSVDYIVARLRREGLVHWIEAIRMRRISAFAVAVELGWAKRPQTLRGEDCNQARRRRFDVRALIG